jgi:hypothetical protein
MGICPNPILPGFSDLIMRRKSLSPYRERVIAR